MMATGNTSKFAAKSPGHLPRIVQEAFSASKGLLAVGGDSSPLTNKDIGSFVGECNNDTWLWPADEYSLSETIGIRCCFCFSFSLKRRNIYSLPVAVPGFVDFQCWYCAGSSLLSSVFVAKAAVNPNTRALSLQS